MPRESIVLSCVNQTFKSQKDFKEFITSFLNIIGFTKSVKSKSLQSYKVLYEICQRHPEKEEKLDGIYDFSIIPNAINPNFKEVNILKLCNQVVPISMSYCVSGKPSTSNNNFNCALRTTIEDQIINFINLQKHKIFCEICNDQLISGQMHVDHIIHFARIVNDFKEIMKSHHIEMPIQYTKEPLTNRIMFTKQNEHLSKMWYDYHKKHAKLRKVCATCNLSRPKDNTV